MAHAQTECHVKGAMGKLLHALGWSSWTAGYGTGPAAFRQPLSGYEPVAHGIFVAPVPPFLPRGEQARASAPRPLSALVRYCVVGPAWPGAPLGRCTGSRSMRVAKLLPARVS